MSIIYSRTDFVTFFETEKTINQEKNSVEYGITYSDGSQFSLHIQSNDALVTLTLTKQEFTNPLFTVNLTGVKKIVCDATSIVLYENENDLQTEPFFVITLRPSVSWHY